MYHGFFLSLFFLRSSFLFYFMYRLTVYLPIWNSLSSCLSLWSAGITCVHHHEWLNSVLSASRTICSFSWLICRVQSQPLWCWTAGGSSFLIFFFHSPSSLHRGARLTFENHARSFDSLALVILFVCLLWHSSIIELTPACFSQA